MDSFFIVNIIFLFSSDFNLGSFSANYDLFLVAYSVKKKMV